MSRALATRFNYGALARTGLRTFTTGRAIYRALRGVQRFRQNMQRRNGGRQQQRGRRVTAGRGVTFQHDVATVYRRKPMPRRKKQKYLRTNRRIQHVIDKSLNTRVILRNGNQLSGSEGQGNQTVMEFWLYGLNGTDQVANGQNDVAEIMNNEFPIDPTIPTFAQPRDAMKIRFELGVLDLTCCNTSPAGPVEGLIPKLEVDVYEMIGLGTYNTFANATAMYTAMANQTPTIKAAEPLTLADRGATPFTFPQSAKYLRIIKKTKYFLSGGQTFTYQIRDPKNRTLQGNVLANNTSFIWKFVTRGVYIVFKPVIGTIDFEGQYSLQVGSTRQYNYVVPDMYPAADGGIL